MSKSGINTINNGGKGYYNQRGIEPPYVKLITSILTFLDLGTLTSMYSEDLRRGDKGDILNEKFNNTLLKVIGITHILAFSFIGIFLYLRYLGYFNQRNKTESKSQISKDKVSEHLQSKKTEADKQKDEKKDEELTDNREDQLPSSQPLGDKGDYTDTIDTDQQSNFLSLKDKDKDKEILSSVKSQSDNLQDYSDTNESPLSTKPLILNTRVHDPIDGSKRTYFLNNGTYGYSNVKFKLSTIELVRINQKINNQSEDQELKDKQENQEQEIDNQGIPTDHSNTDENPYSNELIPRIIKQSISINEESSLERIPVRFDMYSVREDKNEKDTEFLFLRLFENRLLEIEECFKSRIEGMYLVTLLLDQYDRFIENGEGEDNDPHNDDGKFAYHFNEQGRLCVGWNPSIDENTEIYLNTQVLNLRNEFLKSHSERKKLLLVRKDFDLKKKDITNQQDSKNPDIAYQQLHYLGETRTKNGEDIDKDIGLLKHQINGITSILRLISIRNVSLENGYEFEYEETFDSFIEFLEHLPGEVIKRVTRLREGKVRVEYRNREKAFNDTCDKIGLKEIEDMRKMRIQRISKRRIKKTKIRIREKKETIETAEADRLRELEEIKKRKEIEDRKSVLKFNRNLDDRIDLNGDHILIFLHNDRELHRISVPAQHIIFLERLIDQCNDIIAKKPYDILDFQYHGNDNDLICKGKHPENINGNNDYKIEQVIRRIRSNSNQKQLLNIKGCLDKDTQSGSYRLRYIDNITSKDKALNDLVLLKDQLELISTVMSDTIYNENNKELPIFRELLEIIGKRIYSKISEYINNDNNGRIFKGKEEEKQALTLVREIKIKDNEDTGGTGTKNEEVLTQYQSHDTSKSNIDIDDSNKTFAFIFILDDRAIVNLNKFHIFLIQKQYFTLFRELLSYMKEVINKPKSTKNIFPYYGHYYTLLKGKVTKDYAKKFLDLNNKFFKLHKKMVGSKDIDLLLEFLKYERIQRTTSYKLNHSIKEDDPETKLYRLNYLGNINTEKAIMIENLMSLRCQVEGMIDMLEIIGSGIGIGNERDYKTLLCLLNEIPNEVSKYINSMGNLQEIEKSILRNNLRLDSNFFDRSNENDGGRLIDIMKNQYRRDDRINNLLPTSQKILTKRAANKYRKLRDILPSTSDTIAIFSKNQSFVYQGLSYEQYLKQYLESNNGTDMKSKERCIETYRNKYFPSSEHINLGYFLYLRSGENNMNRFQTYRDNYFSLFRHNLEYFHLDESKQNMISYNSKLFKLGDQLSDIKIKYLNYKGENEIDSERSEILEDYGDMISLMTNHKIELKSYYASLESIHDKSPELMDTGESIAFHRYRMMASRVIKEMGEITSHEVYRLLSEQEECNTLSTDTIQKFQPQCLPSDHLLDLNDSST